MQCKQNSLQWKKNRTHIQIEQDLKGTIFRVDRSLAENIQNLRFSSIQYM